jgi:glucose/arabinose dehydrogenase
MSRYSRLIAAGLWLSLLTPLVHALDLTRLHLPAGFKIAVYAEQVPDARQLALGSHGTLFIGTREAGRVYAAVDADRDRVAERMSVVAEGLPLPSGVAFRDGALYVAARDRVLRYVDIESHLDAPPTPEQVVGGLPKSAHHGWKFIAFGPDGALYVPVGAPCNICAPDFPYATILRVPTSGGEVSAYARGVRNSVAFDWHPKSGELWFAEHGRDMLGDDVPPDEINRVSKAGEHFGYPYVHGGVVLDPEFGQGHRIDEFTAPTIKLGAHVAPVGLMFYRGTMFPPAYRGALLVAEHGSWNRSRKAGYRVMVAHLKDDGSVASYEPFITGWLDGEDNWGRPVAFAGLEDGSLLLSDDQAGVVYRITYQQP